MPGCGVDDVVLARPRGCTRYGDDVETVYYCVQYTGAVIDVSRHVIVSQWNERKSEFDPKGYRGEYLFWIHTQSPPPDFGLSD